MKKYFCYAHASIQGAQGLQEQALQGISCQKFDK